MKCNKCGEVVEVQPGKSVNFCFNCGNKMQAEKTEGWQFFDNTKELLAFVASEYGNDALFGRKHFSDHSSHLMPEWQKNLVKQAFECGAVNILKDDLNSDQSRRELAAKRAVGKMIDRYRTSDEDAIIVIWEFTNALGWGMAEPMQPATSCDAKPESPPKRSQPGSVTSFTMNSDATIDNLMALGWQSAGIGDWDEAGSFFKEARKANHTYAPVFVGLICVDLKCVPEDKLADLEDPNKVTGHKFYPLAAADPAVKAQLDKYVQKIKDRNEYENACKVMQSAKTSADYNRAVSVFRKITTSFSDIAAQVKAKIAECEQLEQKALAAEKAQREKERVARIEAQLNDVCDRMDKAKSPSDYDAVITDFGKIDSNIQTINAKIAVKIELCHVLKEVIRKKAEADFNKACQHMKTVNTSIDCERLVWVFKEIAAFYEDLNAQIKSKIVECKQMYKQFIDDENIRKRIQDQFDNACKIMNNAKITDDYRIAIAVFGSIDSKYQDINSNIKSKVSECEQRIAAVEADIRRKYGFLLKRYSAEYRKQAEQRRKVEQEQLGIVVNKENTDIEAYISGDIVYIKSGGNSYRVIDAKGDRAKLQTSQGEEYILEGNTIKSHIAVGKNYSFGGIDWRVLAVENNKALLISEKILEKRPYNFAYKEITWDNCTLRNYLNGEFYNKLGAAKSAIADTQNNNPNNPWYGIRGGNATSDKIFLLNLDEVVKYFGDSGALAQKKGKEIGYFYRETFMWNKIDIPDTSKMCCFSDQYNNARIANYGSEGASWWWLRSSGSRSRTAACVYHAARVHHGSLVNVSGCYVDDDSGGVRPALWLNLESEIF